MCKKGLSVLVLLSLWMCLTGFASLGEEGKDTWNSMMEQLSAEEIDQLLAEENEWYGKVMANVEDSVTIRAEASSDSAAVGKMFKGDAGEILEQHALLKVLAAADKQQVVLGMVKGVAYGDLVYRHLDSPLPTAILQAHNIASIAVQIQQIRVQMRNSHFQNASLPKCSANLGRIAIIAV